MERNHFKNLGSSFAVGLTIIGVVVLLVTSRSEPQALTLSPYSDFQAMNLEQLKTLQVKLTYLGIQNVPIPSVAFTTSFQVLDLNAFKPFRRPGIRYSNDDFVPVQTFTASPTEMKAIIDNVAVLSNVTAGGVAAGPYLSFALLNTVGPKAFEAVLNRADTADLVAKLRVAIQGNKAGLRVLSEAITCTLDLLEPGRPVDVTTSVNVAISGVRLNRTTGRFVGTATVTNTSGQSLSGPVSVMLDLGGNVTLFNADGITCGISPVGLTFINLPLSGNVLPSAGSAKVTLEFENPDAEPIKATTKVLAGPGAR